MKASERSDAAFSSNANTKKVYVVKHVFLWPCEPCCVLLEHVLLCVVCHASSFGGPDARWASGAFGLRAG